jgi:hypothetical protein
LHVTLVRDFEAFPTKRNRATLWSGALALLCDNTGNTQGPRDELKSPTWPTCTLMDSSCKACRNPIEFNILGSTEQSEAVQHQARHSITLNALLFVAIERVVDGSARSSSLIGWFICCRTSIMHRRTNVSGQCVLCQVATPSKGMIPPYRKRHISPSERQSSSPH